MRNVSPPPCPHCPARLDTYSQLDMHLQYQCPGLRADDLARAAVTVTAPERPARHLALVAR